jgi:hypothetical protein
LQSAFTEGFPASGLALREASTGKPIKTKIKNMITKKEELEIITETIGKLGEKSYLGPWLSSIRFELESAIRSDLVPEISLRDTRDQCERLIADANRQAVSMLARAENQVAEKEKEAKALINRAREKVLETHKALVSLAMNSL